MCISLIFVSSVLSLITGQTFDISHQGIISLLNHTIPADTVTFIAGHNSIPNIPAGYFHGNLTNLLNIRLKDNLISDLDDYVFAGATNVRQINLAHNNVSLIRRHTFSSPHGNLTNLVKIFLHNNVISDIQDYAFSNAPNVEEIHLNHNKLSAIHQHTFSGTPRLYALYLSNN